MNDKPEYFENHPNDSRVTGPHTTANAVVQRYGTGGGNLPLVKCAAFKHSMGAKAHGIGYADEQAPTIGTDAASNAVCFSKQDNGREATDELAPTMRSQQDSRGGGNFATVCFEPGQLKRDGSDNRVVDEMSPTIRSNMGDNQPAVCINDRPAEFDCKEEIAHGLRATDYKSPHLYQQYMQVRRLLPEECELLQGFPVGWTSIAWKKKEPEDCPDGPRYKALGNSMAVPVMRWIGMRIDQLINGGTP